MQTLRIVLVVLASLGPALALLQPLVVMAMFLSLRAARVEVVEGEEEDEGRVCLRGMDAFPFACALAAALLITFLLVILRGPLGLSVLTLVGPGVVGLALAFSLRVDVVVEGERVVLRRRVLFVLTWRRVVLRHPSAWIDGWGDMSDPEALHVGDAQEGIAVELGWSSSAEGDRAAELARRFEQAARARPLSSR